MDKFFSTFIGKIILIVFFSIIGAWFLKEVFALLYNYIYQPTNYSGIFLLPNLDKLAGFLLSYPLLASFFSFTIKKNNKRSILLLISSLLPLIIFSIVSSFWISFIWYIVMSISGYLIALPAKLIIDK